MDLDAFARAKRSDWDPRKGIEKRRRRDVVRKHRYYKLLKREGLLLEQEKDSDRSDANAQDLECSLPDGREETKVSNATCIQDDEKNEVQASDGKNKKKNRKKRSSTIEKLYEKSLRRKEAEQISRKEQVLIAEERRNIREEALAKRKHKTARMKKVNRKGQPLMQARVENILEKLEKET